jgi:hypothetical protein
VTGHNKRSGYVPLARYADRESARRGDHQASAYSRELSGRWKFFLAPEVQAVPTGFYEAWFDDSS